MNLFERRKVEKAILKRRDLMPAFYACEEGHMTLRFSSDEELFDPALTGGKIPRISDGVFESMDAIILSFRRKSLLGLSVAPPAGSKYTEAEFAHIFRENLSLHMLKLLQAYRKSVRFALALLCGGCLLLALSYLSESLFDSTLVFDVINILGSLLIWTAGEQYFLQQSGNRLLRNRYAMFIAGRTEVDKP